MSTPSWLDDWNAKRKRHVMLVRQLDVLICAENSPPQSLLDDIKKATDDMLDTAQKVWKRDND